MLEPGARRPLAFGQLNEERSKVAITSEDKAILVAQLCDERKGEGIEILNVGTLCSFTDYLVLVTGLSSTHLRAMAELSAEKLREVGVAPLGIEGEQFSGWTLIDYGDVVVHLFLDETRRYYALERLWGDAVHVEWRAAVTAEA